MEAKDVRWAGSDFMTKLVFGDVTEGYFCEIAFDFIFQPKEHHELEEWVWSQRRKHATWSKIYSMLLADFESRGKIVYRIQGAERMLKRSKGLRMHYEAA